jgi:hypothetical protein
MGRNNVGRLARQDAFLGTAQGRLQSDRLAPLFLTHPLFFQMSITFETLASMRTLLNSATDAVLAKTRKVLEDAEQERIRGHAEVIKEHAKSLAYLADERAKGLADVAKERVEGLADIEARREVLSQEIEAMQAFQAKQRGRVELNIGGFRFQTSVQTLRRVPGTFLDAYFSGRYSQDVCDDGSIFIDRDGEHFGHVLQYLRDGHVSVAEPRARPSLELLLALKHEFDFYCITLASEQLPNTLPEVAFVLGGIDEENTTLSSMERYDVSSAQWTSVMGMSSARVEFGSCVVAGEIYVSGGLHTGDAGLSAGDGMILRSVEKYLPSTGIWNAVASLPCGRLRHAAVAVGPIMYVLGGSVDRGVTASVLKYDSTRDTWSEVAPMPEPRYKFAACAVGTDIFAFGGRNAQNNSQESVFKYDTSTDIWCILSMSPMPSASFEHSCCLLDGLIYIAGARDNGTGLLCFDPASGRWCTIGTTLSFATQVSIFVLGGCLYVAEGNSESKANVERYDPTTDTWTVVAGVLANRRFFNAVTIGSASLPEKDLFDSLILRTSNLIRSTRY